MTDQTNTTSTQPGAAPASQQDDGHETEQQHQSSAQDRQGGRQDGRQNGQEQQQDPKHQDGPDKPDSAAREAARYRTQLRTVEAERDTLASSLRAVRQQMVESVAALAKPDALWAAGVDVDSLFDDAGRMDPEKVQAAVAEQSERLGLAPARRPPRPDRSQGRGPGPSGDGEGWGGAIRAARGR